MSVCKIPTAPKAVVEVNYASQDRLPRQWEAPVKYRPCFATLRFLRLSGGEMSVDVEGRHDYPTLNLARLRTVVWKSVFLIDDEPPIQQRFSPVYSHFRYTESKP